MNIDSLSLCCSCSSGVSLASKSLVSTSGQYCFSRNFTASTKLKPLKSSTKVMTSPPFPQPKHLYRFNAVSSIKDGDLSPWKTQQHFLRFCPAFSSLVPGHKSITSWQMSTLDLMASMYFSLIMCTQSYKMSIECYPQYQFSNCRFG